MTEAAAGARFALDEDRAREWIFHAIEAYEGREGEALPEAHLPGISDGYNPRDDGDAPETRELVTNARLAGVLAGPGEIDWDYDYDEDGYGYTWLLRIGVPGSRLTLSGLRECLRHLGDRDAQGPADRALSVLREAVSAGNEMLDELSRYVAALPRPVRGA